MEEDRVIAFSQRLADDPALLNSLIDNCDVISLAAALAKLEGSSAEWEAWLRRAQSDRDLPPKWHIDAAPPPGWLPNKLFSERGEVRVEWVHSLEVPLTDPFFDDSMLKMWRHPLNLLLRCKSSLDVLAPFAECDQPDVVIFHISRCGSTLVARMFGAMEGTRVFAEPTVLDAAIQLYLRGEIDPILVRGLAGALGRSPGDPCFRRVIKLGPWHCLAFDQIADLFPGASTILLFRDPIEVLVSHRNSPGMQVLKGAIPYHDFGLHGAFEVANAEFATWAIAAISRAALAAADRPGLLVCDYADLPAAFAERILPHCAITASASEIEAFTMVSRQHSKRPETPFASDSLARQSEAEPELREFALRYDLPRIHAGLQDRAGARG